MTPSKWEVWLVNMPFDEGVGSKTRPALVIDPQKNHIIVGKMTTHSPRSNFPYEYQMIDWKGAGLHCQTTLRLSHLPKISPSAFIKRLGVIQPVDQANVRALLIQILSSYSNGS